VFRAYNKGVELGLGEDYTRFELELRKKAANVAAKRLIHGEDIGAIIRHVVDIPDCQWWEDIMGAKPKTLGRFAQPEQYDPIASRWRWLEVQVAPAVGRLLHSDVLGQANFDRFLRQVEREHRNARKRALDS
jgi:DNA relaxase NicK